MSMAKFLKQYRKQIDAVIHAQVPQQRINDDERELWVLNDESLYLLARKAGVDV